MHYAEVVRTLIMKHKSHLLPFWFFQRQILVGDVVDQLGCLVLSGEGNVVVEVYEGVALAGDVSLKTPALTFNGE